MTDVQAQPLLQRSVTPFHLLQFNPEDRRSFFGGSDARIIMGDDEALLLRLWREKRGEIEPGDLSDNLIVQFGTITEDLNRRWYERHTDHVIKRVQRRLQHPVNKWMAATLDGLVEPSGAVFEAKFMLPWSFSEEGAAEKHMAQLQHNMWVATARSAVLSIITGGGKWLELTVHADPLYQHLLLTAEKKFWRCVMTDEPPCLFNIEPPRPRLAAERVIDMSASNSWAELASAFRRTRPAHQGQEETKSSLKKLVPEDAKEASGAWASCQTRQEWRDQLRSLGHRGGACISLVPPSAPLRQRSPRRKATWLTRKRGCGRPSARRSRARPPAPFAMPHLRVVSTSFARVSGSNRNHSNDPYRCSRADQADDLAGSRLRRMDFLGLAGLLGE
jgi:hypothetical protein